MSGPNVDDLRAVLRDPDVAVRRYHDGIVDRLCKAIERHIATAWISGEHVDHIETERRFHDAVRRPNLR